MPNEHDDTESNETLDGLAGITDADILSAYGSDLDTSDDVDGDDETLTDEESGDDADGDNDGEDSDSDDAADADAGDDDNESGDDDSEEDDASDDEESDDTEDQDKDGKMPKGVPALQKRVGKLTKRLTEATTERDQIRAQVTELQTKLEKAAPTVLQPMPGNPLSDLTTETAVMERVEVMKSLKKWCRDNPEGGTLKDAQGKDVEIDAKGVRQRLDYADEVLTEYAPQRLQHLKLEQSIEPELRNAYPSLFEDGSEDRKLMDSFLRVCPELMRVPNYKLIIGDSIRGMRERMKTAKQAAEKKPGVDKAPAKDKAKAPEAKKPAPRAITPAPAKSTTQGKATTTKRQQDFMKTGSKDALTAFIESTL